MWNVCTSCPLERGQTSECLTKRRRMVSGSFRDVRQVIFDWPQLAIGVEQLAERLRRIESRPDRYFT